MVTRRPASTSGYTSMIHSCSAPVGASATEISGSAKLSTVLSTETSSTGSMSTASAAQPRAPTRAPSVSITSIDAVAGMGTSE